MKFNLKTVASWLSTACLVIAVWSAVRSFITTPDLFFAFTNPSVLGAAILSLALGSWNPPAKIK